MIDNRYEYIRLIGRGSSGTVYLAYDHKLHKNWAIKELEGGCNQEKSMELKLLKTLSCHAFPRLADAVFEADKTYLVMDYVEGVTLKSMMKRGPMKEKEVIKIALQLAEGLHYLHNLSPRMIYMDCKPDNIMIDKNGEVKLIDLGSVYVCRDYMKISGTDDFVPRKQKIRETDDFTPWRQKISGTVIYAPLEQKKARREQIGVSTDVYAFGMTLVSLLAGKELLVKKQKHFHIQNYNRGISAGMSFIIRKCTEESGRARFQSMDEIIYCLRHIKSISKRESCLSGFQRMLFLIGKILLAFTCILCFSKYSQTGDLSRGILGAVAMLTLFFFGIFHQRKEIWELQKNVCCTMGKRMILGVFLATAVLISFSIHTMAKNSENDTDILKVTLYDEEFRKILIKTGYAWKVKEDIFLSIDKEEIAKEQGYIEISYVPENSEKKNYYFLVEGK